jgi:hypothetical protein
MSNLNPLKLRLKTWKKSSAPSGRKFAENVLTAVKKTGLGKNALFVAYALMKVKKMKFSKTNEEFSRDLRFHLYAVQICLPLLGVPSSTHDDINPDVRLDQKNIYHGDLIVRGQLVKIVGTKSDRIYITPRCLNFLSQRAAAIYYVFFNRSGAVREIRKIEAIELKALERRAFKTRNKYNHPVFVYPREIAELIQQ